MTDLLLSSTWFGFLLSTGTFFLAKAVNRRCGRERINPLLFATVVCGLVIIISGMDYDVYYQGAQYLDVLLSPAPICLAAFSSASFSPHGAPFNRASPPAARQAHR